MHHGAAAGGTMPRAEATEEERREQELFRSMPKRIGVSRELVLEHGGTPGCVQYRSITLGLNEN